MSEEYTRASELEKILEETVALKEELEKILAQGFPRNIEELATLTNRSPKYIEAVIAHICEVRPGRDKYILLDDILTFHRILANTVLPGHK